MPKQQRKKQLKSISSVTTIPSSTLDKLDAEECFWPLLLMLGLGAGGLKGFSGLTKGLGGMFGGNGLGNLFGAMNGMGGGVGTKNGTPGMNMFPGMKFLQGMNGIPGIGNMNMGFGNGFPFTNPWLNQGQANPLQGMLPNMMQQAPKGNSGSQPGFPFMF